LLLQKIHQKNAWLCLVSIAMELKPFAELPIENPAPAARFSDIASF